MVTGRRNVEKYMSNPRYRYRINVIWRYAGDANGMPDRATSEIMEQVQQVFEKEFGHDPVAILTGIYTGDDRRDWIFYTTSLHIYQRKLNEMLTAFPPLPLEFEADEDPLWEEYLHMKEATEITDEE